MSDRLNALRASVERLRDVAAQIDVSHYTAGAYPSEWSIADTFSHIGSGAVIMARRFEEAVNGLTPEPTFNPSVWDQWNAKAPEDQVADALVADALLLDTLEDSSEEDRAKVQISMGPMSLDFDGYVGMRLAEHVLHTWDVETTIDRAATLDDHAAGLLLGVVGRIAGFSGKAGGEVKTITVRTSDPQRDFSVVLAGETVSLEESIFDGDVDLEIPAEAFVRVIYGRLDPERIDFDLQSPSLDTLRGVFAGF
jgi:uncharacterized protein (TIGR03083 family)